VPPSQHLVFGFFTLRNEAEIARTELMRRGIPEWQLTLYTNEHAEHQLRAFASSNHSLKDTLRDSTVGAAVGTALGALGEIAKVAFNSTPFVASPLSAPLVMLVWGLCVGAIVGATVGLMNETQKDGKLSKMVNQALRSGQVVLVVTTQSRPQIRMSIEVIKMAAGTYQVETHL